MATDPDPPESIPTYVREGLDRQDPATLRDVIDYCERRVEFLERDVEDEELAEEDEELVDVREEHGGTIVVKKVPCGKNCGGCPHGPYAYSVRRVDGDLEWEYLGRAEEG